MYWRKEREKEIENLKLIIQPILQEKLFQHFGNKGENELVNGISEKIWKHQQHTKESMKADLLEATQKQIEEDLEKIKEYFCSLYACREDQPQVQGRIRYNRLKEILNICRNEFELCLDPKNMSHDVKEFLQFNPKAHAWIQRENALIQEIREMLHEYVLLNDESHSQLEDTFQAEIISSIFMACSVWTSEKNPVETMRKRFRSIQKKVSQA